jgi:hypothetical protein
MPLRVYNTLGGQIEEFKPLHDNQVGMYTCGPTVYDFAHIGNYRTYVFQDILRRRPSRFCPALLCLAHPQYFCPCPPGSGRLRGGGAAAQHWARKEGVR